MSNSLRIIYPYLDAHDTWVFDDKAVGLVREPFVQGIPEMIYHFTDSAQIVNPGAGFALLFSASNFPGAQAELSLESEEYGGNWYTCLDFRGWLCPALFKYFPAAPPRLFIQCKPIERKMT